jgi:hypothetical protein
MQQTHSATTGIFHSTSLFTVLRNREERREILDIHVASRNDEESTPKTRELATVEEPRRRPLSWLASTLSFCATERKKYRQLELRWPYQFTRLCHSQDTFNFPVTRASWKAFDHVLLLWVLPVLLLIVPVFRYALSVHFGAIRLLSLRLHIPILRLSFRVRIRAPQSSFGLRCCSTDPKRRISRRQLHDDLLVKPAHHTIFCSL